MKMNISNEAAIWYKDELNLSPGSYLRFFVRYGGHSTIQKGFSLGIAPEQPNQLGASTERNELTFFVEEKDLWFFDDHDLLIYFNETLGEPEFLYIQ